MRTEAEIREAIRLCEESDDIRDPFCIIGRDATIEALRWALGIDDPKTSPMAFPLQELLESLSEKDGQSIQE